MSFCVWMCVCSRCVREWVIRSHAGSSSALLHLSAAPTLCQLCPHEGDLSPPSHLHLDELNEKGQSVRPSWRWMKKFVGRNVWGLQYQGSNKYVDFKVYNIFTSSSAVFFFIISTGFTNCKKKKKTKKKLTLKTVFFGFALQKWFWNECL